MNAEDLLKESLKWLKEDFDVFNFLEERDIVWSIHKHMLELIKTSSSKLEVINEYPIVLPPKTPKKEALWLDLAIKEENNHKPTMIVQFKYLPYYNRIHKYRGKAKNSCAVSWENPRKENKESGSVVKDIMDIKKIVEENEADIGYSIFIDEGGKFYNMQKKYEGSHWETEKEGWKKDMAVLIARFPEIPE
jgi:hypothetical protein